MTVLAVVVLGLCLLAAALSGVRWLRVAQREHYLAGSVTRFAVRWWRRDRYHVGLLALGLAAAIAEIPREGVGLATAAIVGVGPFGLSLRGRTSRLVWTRRLAMLAATAATVSGLAVGLSAILGGLRAAAAAAAIVAVVSPGIIDAALLVLGGYEDHRAGRFVEQARVRLARLAPTVVAITGSYGKTTTKGYVAHLLEGRFDVLASPRSFNNRAGLARTINELLVPGTQVLIAEMGAYGPGEIAALCAWIPPRVAVITAIGPVHLERFRTLERTLAAKAEIATAAAITVLNVDDERLAELAEALIGKGQKVLRCSARDRNVDVAVLNADGRLVLFIEGSKIGEAELDGPRPSALSNVACAVGAALGIGASPEELVSRMSNLPLAGNRLERSVSDKGVVVLDDTFNANPAGAVLALERLAVEGAKATRRVVVTPGMIELGPRQFQENADFAQRVTGVATDLVIVGSTNRRALSEGARPIEADLGLNGVSVREFEVRQEAVDWVRQALAPGDVVLYENDLPDHYP